MDRTHQAAEDLMAAQPASCCKSAERRPVEFERNAKPTKLCDPSESSRRDAWTRIGEFALASCGSGKN